eukprot:CAMPEP_0180252882 /NCGR_PEP_ID=MMETSP0987-20121128/39288_1 /TAXON_ID=697907 /ORGANISM="non described non described, Strain CCMP2293" /LENGTH=1010 /DNA_ID=CAMNT_0022221681 /DNA_START=65 /DNA_END=3095 /DNA_ORIENTATION=+
MSEVSSEQQAANDKLVGVIVAIVGNLCISVSFQITKLTHMRNTENKDFTKIPMWWLGLFLMLGGEVGNFFAYGWAPATVVSPLGAVAVVSNCLLSRIFLKEEITVRNLIGVFFAIAGATTIAFTAPTSILLEDNPSNSTDVGDARRSGGGAVSGEYIYDSLVSWRAAGFLLGVLVSAGLLANPCQWKRAVSAELRDKYVVCNVMMCGLLGCITVMSAKGVATAFTQMVKGDFVLWVGPHCWLTWILIVSAIIRRLQGRIPTNLAKHGGAFGGGAGQQGLHDRGHRRDLRQLSSSISFQVTKLAHMRNTENQPFTKIPMWWLGLLLMIGGEVGNFFAYGWAPATVVSPLGAVAVAANCVLARIVLKEALTLRNLIGVFFAILGATAIAFTAPTSILLENRPSNSTANATLSNSTNSSLSTVEQSVSGEYIYESLVSWRAAGFLFGVLVAAAYLGNPFKWKHAISAELRDKYVICNVMMCGLLGAITVMSAKGVATAFTQMVNGDYVLWVGQHAWLTWILIISAVGSIVGQVQFLNRAMMGFGASEVVPVYFVIFTITTVTAGMVLYLEVNFGDWWRALFFVIGIVATFFGVYLINQRTAKEEDKEEDEDDDEDGDEVEEEPLEEGSFSGESRHGLVARNNISKKARMTPISEGKGDGWAAGGVVQPPNGLQEGDVDVSVHSWDGELREHSHSSEPDSPASLSARSGRSQTSTSSALQGPHNPRTYHSAQNTPRRGRTSSEMLPRSVSEKLPGAFSDSDVVPAPRRSVDHAAPRRSVDHAAPRPVASRAAETSRVAEFAARPQRGARGWAGSVDDVTQTGIPLFELARAVEYMRRQSTSPALISITSPREKAPALDAGSLEAGHGGSAQKLRNVLHKAPDASRTGSDDDDPSYPSYEISPLAPTEPDADVVSSVAGRFGHLLGFHRPPAKKEPSEGRTPPPDEAGPSSPVTPIAVSRDPVPALASDADPETVNPPSLAKGPNGAKPGSSKISRRYERLEGSGTWEQAGDDPR